MRMLQAEGRPQDGRGGAALPGVDLAPEEQRVAPGVGPDPGAQHADEHGEGLRQVLVHDASLQEVVVHMDIQAEVVRQGQVLAELEGDVELAAAVRQLHQDGEGEVARLHAVGLHLLEDLHALLVQVLACTAIQECVVGLLIRPHVLGLLHGLQQLPSLVQAVVLAVALEHGAVGHEVRLDPLLEHLLEQEGRAAAHAAP
mmetsp:Transcript_28010/g.80360  ORF Transcript_28010/g.80360 Transcript_28010/m.80360 type:complete len:200 (-) Transcript_28010:604-1203(-)